MSESSMLIQRPASSHCQETLHILVSTFRELFVEESVNEETVQHLAASKCGNRSYHDKYVEKLQKIQDEYHEKVKKAEYVMQHLVTAKDKARSEEERETLREKEKWQSYTDLGLPPVSSQLDVFLDKQSLESCHLITPSVFAATDINDRKQPKVTSELSTIPRYTESTLSSRLLFNKQQQNDNYFPEDDPILHINSNYKQSKPKRKKSAKTNSQNDEKNLWRNCINPYERELEKKDIANLQKKADFLKNPRFNDEPKYLTNKNDDENLLNNDKVFFKPVPSVVIFENYQLGHSYELKLELKNITTSCRQVRALQPTTKYFTVDSGDFPDESGLVAPGMSCQYNIQFTPDSLADFDDYITVKTQANEPLCVTIQARRTPPLLSLPSSLNCGYSLVGKKKEIKIEVINNGGNGRFIFQLNDYNNIFWDKIDYTEASTLAIQPFTISPSRFEILSEQTITVTITFEPLAVKYFVHDLKLYCDNCSVTNYSIQGFGEIANCELSFVEGGTCLPQLGETFDESAKQMLQYGRSHPNHLLKREIVVTNKISVPLSFHWSLFLPNISSSKDNRREKLSPIFKVFPDRGILQEKSDSKFEICFEPTELGSFFEVTSLMLEDIPTPQSDGRFINKEETSITLGLKGYSECNEIEIEPSTVLITGKCYIGKSYTRYITVRNKKESTISVAWKNIKNNDYSIILDPFEFWLGKNEEKEISITVASCTELSIDAMIQCVIPYPLHQYGLYLKTKFIGPHLKFMENSVDFGLIQFGKSDNSCLTLVNDSPIQANWSLQLCQQEYESSLTYYPTEGSLDANNQQVIAVHFESSEPCSIHTFFKCIVNEKVACCLPVHVEVQRPHVCVKESSMIIDTCYLNVPISRPVTLVNTGLLSTKYDWKKLSNYNDKDVSVRFDQVEGCIAPLQSVQTIITLTFHNEGASNVILPCYIEDMVEPVFISVDAIVKGLDVEISIPNIDDMESGKESIANENCIEFGSNVLLGQEACALLMVKNKTAIKAKFTLHPEHFTPARNSTTPSIDDDTINVDDKCLDQERKDGVDKLLQDGRGVAIVCSIENGTLDAFEKKLISVFVYSDMWGEYNDRLVCKIGDLDVKYIPLHVDVVGTPLSFQMSKEQPPVIRFGSHVSGSQKVIRNMKINNSSHTDIRLDWQNFVLNPNDDKLIDLDVYMGELFPLLDDSAKEIECENNNNKLFTVLLNEHQGERTDIPFEVVTKQVVVAGKNSATIQVSFAPVHDGCKEKKYLGYALGYMSLTNEDSFCCGKYSRTVGLDMLPFALNMTGTVRPAKLVLEACDEEQFTFELSATKLLKSSCEEEIACSHRYVLLNKSDAIVQFQCQIEKPFIILKEHPDVVKTKAITKKKRKKEDKMTSLKPGKNIEIRVVFELTNEMASTITDCNQTIFKRMLNIEFNNKKKQEYEMHGIVNFPMMQLLHNTVDFGVCYVGERRELVLTIQNPSKAALFWRIDKDLQCPEACLNVFSFTTTNGKVNSNEHEDNFIDVKIQFIAAHNVSYECTLNVTSLFHEEYLKTPPTRVILHGRGSYDEATKQQQK